MAIIDVNDDRVIEAIKWAKKLGLLIAEPITAPWLNREEWLVKRMDGLGSSEIWALFSDDLDDRRDLYLRKIGAPEPDLAMGPDLERGRVYEDIAAAKYEEKTGRKTIPLPLLLHPSMPWLLTDVDRLILPGTGNGHWYTEEPMILEIKCPRGHVWTRYKRKGLPEKIIWQQTHHAAVTGIKGTAFAAFNAETLEILEWDLDAEPDFIARIENEGEEFWKNNVAVRIEPDVGSVPVNGVAIDTVAGDTVMRDDPEYLKAAATFKDVYPVFKEAETLLKDAKAGLRKLVGKEPGRCEGGGVACNNSLRQGSAKWKDSFEKVADAFPLDSAKLREMLQDGTLRLKNGEVAEIEDRNTIVSSLVLNVDSMKVVGEPTVAFLPRLVREED